MQIHRRALIAATMVPVAAGHGRGAAARQDGSRP
jgi:hypothetical protein